MTTWELVMRFLPTVLGIVAVPGVAMVGLALIGNAIQSRTPRTARRRNRHT